MIGEEFKTRREALGLDQKALAAKLAVGQSAICRIEAGLKMPSVMLVKLAAELFGCTTDDLIMGKRALEDDGKEKTPGLSENQDSA